MRAGSALERLPNEVRDLVLDHLFASTHLDYPGAQKAELRVYTGHVILRRICPIPPPRFKGCRALMKSCKAMCHYVLEYVYSRLEFIVVIYGNAKDPGPRFNRLTSEYPIGTTRSSMPLRYIKNMRLFLNAWSAEDIERIKLRLTPFLEIFKDNVGLKVHSIGFHAPSPGSLNEVAKMLEKLRSRVPTQVYSEHDSVSEERLQHLLIAINGDYTAAGR